MATWAIGDIQGCFATLTALLDAIGFDRSDDRVWLVGDLVNRGPASARVLRWARANEARVTCVLGNHDLHLLAMSLGIVKSRGRDTAQSVLMEPDAAELIAWLRHRPLLHREGSDVMVHAGIHPMWAPEQAGNAARELEAELRSEGCEALLRASFAATNPQWSPSLADGARRVAALAALTRMRVCSVDGMDHGFKGPMSDIKRGQYPWFDVPGRRSRAVRVVFGHWAALGLRVGDDHIGLDTGCVWGRALTAIRMNDLRIVQVPTAPEDRT